MYTKFRHKVFFGIAMPVLKLFGKIKYNFKYKKYKLGDKPHLILCNHSLTMDPFMMCASFDRPIYFMSSEDLFNKWYSGLLRYLTGAIPKAKGSKDTTAVRQVIKVMKEGGNVGIFPEGNRTLSSKLCYIDKAIAKLAKLSKADVVLYNLKGGYQTEARFCKKPSRGLLEGCVREVITAEEVKSMDVDALYNRIIEGLTVELYDDVKFKSNCRAEYIERALYVCPNCGNHSKIRSKGDIITCDCCDMKLRYDEYCKLQTISGEHTFDNVGDWYDYQVEWTKNYHVSEGEHYFAEDIEFIEVHNEGKNKSLGKYFMRITDEGLLFDNESGNITITLDDIENIALVGKSKMIIYSKVGQYQVRTLYACSLLKFMYMYYVIRNRKEGVENGTNYFMGL